MWASINDSMLSSVHLFQSLRLCYSRRVRELLAVQMYQVVTIVDVM